MAFRKSIKQSGDENQANEQLSHNRVVIEGGSSALLLVAFACTLVLASIVFMAVVHLQMLESLVVASFVGGFVCLWIVALGFTIRHSVTTATVVSIQKAQRTSPNIRVVESTDHWALWIDESGRAHFEGTTAVTENRQFLPAPGKPPDIQEAVLTLYDTGMSARGIERHLKTSGIENASYRQVVKVLDLYRKGWNAKATIDSNLADETE